jgi:hypothetical protein
LEALKADLSNIRFAGARGRLPAPESPPASPENGKREAPQDEFPAAMLARWPASGRRDEQVHRAIQLSGKLEGCCLVPFQVPTEREFQFFQSGRMSLQRLNGH